MSIKERPLEERLRDQIRDKTNVEMRITKNYAQIASLEEQLKNSEVKITSFERQITEKIRTQNIVERKYANLIENIDTTYNALLRSWRWRTGDFICSLPGRILRRERVSMGADHIKDLIREYKKWKVKKEKNSRNVLMDQFSRMYQAGTSQNIHNEDIESLRVQSRKIEHLIVQLDTLNDLFGPTFNSMRWKVGDFLCSMPKKVLMKPIPPLGKDLIISTLKEYEVWKKNIAAREVDPDIDIEQLLLEKSSEINKLIEFMGRIEETAIDVFSSYRWKVGDFFCSLPNKVLLRASPSIAKDSIFEILRQFGGGYKDESKLSAAQLKWAGGEAKGKIVIYTAIAGGYDELKIPEFLSKNCDYVCFSDKNIDSPQNWQIRSFDYFNNEPVRMARHVKLHPHFYFPEYEWSIWIDSNLLQRGNLEELIWAMPEELLMATFKHPHRDCIYEEAKECLKRGLEKPQTVKTQIDRYREEGYPAHNGLSETNVLVRRHNEPEIINLMNDWWKELDNGSKRDQLSLNYVAFKNSFEIGALAADGISVRNDPRLTRFSHGDDSEYISPAPVELPIRDDTKEPFPWPESSFDEQPKRFAEGIKDISVDIVVCIYNSLDDVKECLSSIDVARLPNHRLILVDDGSDDDTRQFLEGFLKEHPSDILVRNDKPGGYTKAANAGIRKSTGDYVIMLNSDTIVSNDWIFRLLECGESSEDIGMIGPMSNAASWQSIPEVFDAEGDLAINEIPEGLDISHMVQLVEFCSPPFFPRVPLLNGFCIALKRSVIDKVGLFDEEAFPDGYGEENDYCLRASDAGFSLAIATHAYVFHAKSKSYSHERRRELSKKGSKAFRAKYSALRISNAIESMRNNPYLKHIRDEAEVFLRETCGENGLNCKSFSILFILSGGGGGGGSHSVIQEASGMSNFGTRVKVAVQEKHLQTYINNYGSFIEGLLLPFEDDHDLYEKSASFDVVVATHNETMHTVAKMIARNPEMITAYYIQDYEPLFYKKVDIPRRNPVGRLLITRRLKAAEESYTRVPGMVSFAKTRWLCETVGKHHNVRVHKVRPSIDRDIYYPDLTPKKSESVKVCAMVRIHTPRRGPERTMRVLERIAKEYGDKVEIQIFGSDMDAFKDAKLARDFKFVNHGMLVREEVADILRESDIFIDLSDYQAFGRTGLEAMACGATSILPVDGGADEYVLDGINGLVVDTSSEDDCFDSLSRLVVDDKLLSKLQENALKTASRYSIPAAALSELFLLRLAYLSNARFGPFRVFPYKVGKSEEAPTAIAPKAAVSKVIAKSPSRYFPVAGDFQSLDKEVTQHDVSYDELERNNKLIEAFRKDPHLKAKHILWFLPSFDHIYRGGIHTIFRAAESFTTEESVKHTFVIIGKLKKTIDETKKMIKEAFPLVKFKIIRFEADDDINSLPSSDAAFCTLWNTSYLLVKYNKCKAKFYFVQDYEPGFYEAGSTFGLIEQSYRFGFNIIANTPGVAEVCRRYTSWVDYFIPAVNRKLYYPDGEKINTKRPYRIVFYGRAGRPRNGFRLGIEALHIVKEHFKDDVEIISVGEKFSSVELGLEGILKGDGVLLDTFEEVASLYRSSDVGLVFMYTAHPSYQPLEFMASGCVTVTNNNELNRWILRDNDNAIVTQSTVSCVASRIIEVLENDELRQRIVDGGLATIDKMDWDVALKKIRSIVANPKPATESFLD